METDDVPLRAFAPLLRPLPIQAANLTTSTRNHIRAGHSILMPTEKKMKELMLQLAETHGTATRQFGCDGFCGAFILDPIKLIRVVKGNSLWVAVGGDCGGKHTKLGVTYMDAHGKSKYVTLWVMGASDDWGPLHTLLTLKYPFEGESIGHPSIFSVLQQLIDEGAFLNGDWMFLSAVAGLTGPNSTYPCPICMVPHSHLLKPNCSKRTDKHKLGRNLWQTPLLTCPSDRIIPLPLHIYLGFGNRIIDDIFVRKLGKEAVQEFKGTCKSLHSVSGGGLSDIFKLNGAEVRQWVKTVNMDELISHGIKPLTNRKAWEHRIRLIAEWLEGLHKHLLHGKVWKSAQVAEFKELVKNIQEGWEDTANDGQWPKLHMLTHAVEFAEKHHILGRLSEAPMESAHAQFNQLFHFNHRNMLRDRPEQFRRCMANVATSAVQPVALREITKATNNNSSSHAMPLRSKSI
jgi:hypothetical protein